MYNLKFKEADAIPRADARIEVHALAPEKQRKTTWFELVDRVRTMSRHCLRRISDASQTHLRRILTGMRANR